MLRGHSQPLLVLVSSLSTDGVNTTSWVDNGTGGGGATYEMTVAQTPLLVMTLTYY